MQDAQQYRSIRHLELYVDNIEGNFVIINF